MNFIKKHAIKIFVASVFGLITVPTLIFLFLNWPLDPTNRYMPNSIEYRQNFKKAAAKAKEFENANVQEIILDKNYGEYLKKIGIEIDNSKIVGKNISDKDLKLDEIINFKHKKANFKITRWYRIREMGRVIVYIRASEHIISNPERNEIFVILDGFDHEIKLPDNNIETREIVNNIGIKIINNEAGTITNSNGFFIDYEINEKENYPTTWYLMLPLHSLEYFSNLNNYDLTSKYLSKKYKENSIFSIYNSNSSLELKNVNLVFTGFDIFKSNLNYLKNYSNKFNEDENIEEYIDFAVLEIKFNTEEEAKRYTSISEIDYFSNIFLKENVNFTPFDKFNFQFRNAKDNSIVKSNNYYVDDDPYLHYNPYILFNNKSFKTSFLINNNFISKFNYNQIDGENYVDITTGIGFSETGFDNGSSGSIIYNQDFFGYKVSNYRNINVGVYVPLIWNNISSFKSNIVDQINNPNIFNDLVLESYNLIYGNEKTQKNWYLKSLREIHPKIKTYLSSLNKWGNHEKEE